MPPGMPCPDPSARQQPHVCLVLVSADDRSTGIACHGLSAALTLMRDADATQVYNVCCHLASRTVNSPDTNYFVGLNSVRTLGSQRGDATVKAR